jgi:hypothetical protein
MKYPTKLSLAFVAVLAIPACVYAQTTPAYKIHCMTTGTNAMEPIGDRSGHSISVGQSTCKVDGGPLDGGLMTASAVYEWDGVNGVSKASNGVVRKPGAMAIYVNTDFKTTLTMAEGKVIGSVSSGSGHFILATGTAASLADKAYSFTGKSTGPGQVTLEITIQ